MSFARALLLNASSLLDKRKNVEASSYLKPGMLHDLGYCDPLVRVGGEHPAQKVPALGRHVRWLLEVRCHYAREHLLQPDKVVASIISSLRKRQDACVEDAFLGMSAKLQTTSTLSIVVIAQHS